MMNNHRDNIELSVIAGIFATVGSLFGKLAGRVYFTSMASSLLIKLLLLTIMMLCNTIGCTLFVKALGGSESSSLPATVTSATTNYFCSALVGFLVFGESTSTMWWCGTSLVLLGLILIGCTPQRSVETNNVTKDKQL